MRTFVASAKGADSRWHVIDAGGKVLGRVATLAARLLQGKHKASYTPFIDTGDPASELAQRTPHIDDIAWASYYYPEGSASSGIAALQAGDQARPRYQTGTPPGEVELSLEHRAGGQRCFSRGSHATHGNDCRRSVRRYRYGNVTLRRCERVDHGGADVDVPLPPLGSGVG